VCYQAADRAQLVVLLPVVTLGSLTNLYRAAMVVMMAGANFIAVRSHPSCMPTLVPCLHGRFHATCSHTALASHLHEVSCHVATGSARLNEMSAHLLFQHCPQASLPAPPTIYFQNTTSAPFQPCSHSPCPHRALVCGLSPLPTAACPVLRDDSSGP
jgi:hypothetical protein